MIQNIASIPHRVGSFFRASWQHMASYFRVYTKIRLPWLLILISTAFEIASASSELQVATMTGSIIDGSQTAIEIKQLLHYILLTVMIAVFSVGTNYFIRKMEETTTLRVRTVLWRKIMRLPTRYYDEDNGNELVSRVTSDASAPAALIGTLVTCATSVWAIVQAFILLYNTNRTLANYSLIILPVTLLFFVIYGILQFKLGVYSTKVIASSLGYLAERVRNFRLIKSSLAEQLEAKKGNQAFKRMYVADLLTWLMTGMFQIISSMSTIIFIFIVFVMGGRLKAAGVLTMGDLTSFFMVTEIMSMHLGLFFINAGSLFSTIGCMQKTAKILDTPAEKTEGMAVPCEQDDIIFDHIGFAYNEERQVLNDLSLTIPAGKVTAVIGGNGAGKSTLLKLLTRLYEPQSGHICYLNTNIAEYDLTAWRDRFTYVSQRDPLIGGSVRDNLLYGLDRPVSEEELVEVTKKANCYDCIMEKPGGFDEDVGLEGSNFSGGQAQCIAIARAMLRQSDILLLDEATSNLDAVSEGAVTEALDRLMENKTTLIIAHSYPATRHAEHIIVMKDGHVEAAGVPEALLAHNSYYQTFVKTV